jgi:hypothetical protein
MLAVTAESYAQGRRPNPTPTPRPDNSQIRLIEEVNRQFTGVATLPIIQTFRLLQQYPGYELVSVELQGQSDFGRGQAGLVINNMPSRATQVVGPTRSILRFDLPQNQNIIGDTLRSLQFDLRGRIFVNRLAVTLAPVTVQEVVETRFWQQYTGDNTIQVGRELSLNQHNGKTLEYVELTASSFAGRAQAILQINGQNVMMPQVIGAGREVIRFELPSRGAYALGSDVRTLTIRVVGNVRTDHLAVGLISRRGNAPRPTPGPVFPAVFTAEPNVVVTGTQSISLAQLVNDARQDGRRVTSVEITGRSRNGVGRVQICERLSFRSDCRPVQNLGVAQTVTSHWIGGSRLGDLRIEAQGQMQIMKVVIRFE